MSAQTPKAPSAVDVGELAKRLAAWLRLAASQTLTPKHTLGICGARLTHCANVVEAQAAEIAALTGGGRVVTRDAYDAMRDRYEHALAEKDAEIVRKDIILTGIRNAVETPPHVKKWAEIALQVRDGGAGS